MTYIKLGKEIIVQAAQVTGQYTQHVCMWLDSKMKSFQLNVRIQY